MEFVEYIKSPLIEKVLLRRRGRPYVEGTLCVTGHHLIFSSRTDHSDELIVSNKPNKTSKFSLLNRFLFVFDLIGLLKFDNVLHRQDSLKRAKYMVVLLTCKCLRYVYINIINFNINFCRTSNEE